MGLSVANTRSNHPLDILTALFYPVYQLVFSEDSDFVNNIDTSLKQARVTTPVEIYLSRALGLSVILGVVFWLTATLLSFVVVVAGGFQMTNPFDGTFPAHPIFVYLDMHKEWIITFVSGGILGSIGFTISFWGFVFKPKLEANARKTEISVLMPDAISFMYALAVGGMNQIEIMEAIAEADDTYGEVSKEFQSIRQETQYFDADYRTAIKHQIEVTPNPEFAQFLSDMLSILSSGGDIESFLKNKKHKHIRLAKQHQERDLDTLELLGEMYMTLSLFPLLLIIILVTMQMMGEDQTQKMYGVVYGLIPVTGMAFFVLLSTVKQDEVGDGKLDHPTTNAGDKETRIWEFPIVDKYEGKRSIFSKAKKEENSYQTKKILRNPHVFFREHPLFVLALTLPASIAIIAAAIHSGVAPTTLEEMKDNHVWGTFLYVYVPVYMNFIPLAIFTVWKRRTVGTITGNLSDTLRKLSSANDTGQTLLESMRTVTDSSSGRLAEEFSIIHSKVTYGMRMKEALIEFNNKYSVPRLARITKLITEAQEASENITEVLSTAAQASENQDDIVRQQKSQTRMQVAIILMTYIVLLGVMALLKVKFLDVMADLAAQAGGSGGGGAEGAGGQGGQFGAAIDVDRLSMLFFHAVTIQAIISGLLAGYMRNNDLISGIKFVIILLTIALFTWMYVG